MVSVLSQTPKGPFSISSLYIGEYTRLGVPALPSLLSRKSLVEQGKHLGYVELHVFQVKLILIILLHLKQIVQLKIEFQKTSVATYGKKEESVQTGLFDTGHSMHCLPL